MRVSRHTMALGSVALVLATTASACSSSPDVSTVRQQYLTIVTNTDQALTKDRDVNHQNVSLARYSVTFHDAAVQFRAITFPASMQHDSEALIAALDAMSTQAAKVAAAAAKPQTVEANVVAMAKLNLTLMEQEKNEQKLTDALRKDLGLPPATTTTTTTPTSLKPPSVLSTTTTVAR